MPSLSHKSNNFPHTHLPLSILHIFSLIFPMIPTYTFTLATSYFTTALGSYFKYLSFSLYLGMVLPTVLHPFLLRPSHINFSYTRSLGPHLLFILQNPSCPQGEILVIPPGTHPMNSHEFSQAGWCFQLTRISQERHGIPDALHSLQAISVCILQDLSFPPLHKGHKTLAG